LPYSRPYGPDGKPWPIVAAAITDVTEKNAPMLNAFCAADHGQITDMLSNGHMTESQFNPRTLGEIP
jgi:hypothetical protein